jgi:hypothetical protein
MELYINNIFVNPEVHDIYIKRIGFSPDPRVPRAQRSACNQESADEKLLSQPEVADRVHVGRPAPNV